MVYSLRKKRKREVCRAFLAPLFYQQTISKLMTYKRKEIIGDATLYLGDCLGVMEQFENKELDAVVADPPYGTTKCDWDSVIPLGAMWQELNRITKVNGAFIFTAGQPFTTALISSNIEIFKYCWVWEKPSAKGHLNSKFSPMKAHEDICVFYKKQPTYNPQMTYGHSRKMAVKNKLLNSDVYNPNTRTVSYDSSCRYPRTVQIFKQDTQKSSLHPTQKPVALMNFLIKTYTDKGQAVLDFAMGSGTTGVACVESGRIFVGIEIIEKYFDIACKRIEQAQRQANLF